MNTIYKYGFFGTALVLSLALGACTDDKNYGEAGSEALLINSVDIEKTDYEIKDGSICLAFGQKLELHYTVSPINADNPVLAWSSSNEEIATVSPNGVITAGQKEGQAVIFVTPEIGFGSQEATPTLSVKVIKEVIPVESLTLKTDNEEDGAESTTLLAGENRQMQVTALPEDHTYERYNWVSTNPEVATVDENGFVQTLEKGTTTIKLTTRDGGTASASYTFTVLPSIVPTAVEFINTDKLQNLAYGQTVNLHDYVKLTPTDATFSLIKWSMDDEKMASFDNKGYMKLSMSIKPSTFKLVGHTLKLTASTPEGKVLGSTTVTTDGGYFIHNFKDGMSPYTVTLNGKTTRTDKDRYIHFDISVSGRQDISLAATDKKGGFYVSTAKYKYFAIKIRRPYYYDEENGYSSIKPGTKDGWRYNKMALNITPTSVDNLGHQNFSKMLDLTSATPALINVKWDGQPQVYVFEFNQDKLIKGTDAETGLVDLKYLDLIMADMHESISERSYDIYWMGTFSSLEEIKAYYLANE